MDKDMNLASKPTEEVFEYAVAGIVEDFTINDDKIHLMISVPAWHRRIQAHVLDISFVKDTFFQQYEINLSDLFCADVSLYVYDSGRIHIDQIVPMNEDLKRTASRYICPGSYVTYFKDDAVNFGTVESVSKDKVRILRYPKSRDTAVTEIEVARDAVVVLRFMGYAIPAQPDDAETRKPYIDSDNLTDNNLDNYIELKSTFKKNV